MPPGLRIETRIVSDPFKQLARGAGATRKAMGGGNFARRVGTALAKEAKKTLREDSPAPVKRLDPNSSTHRGGVPIKQQWQIGRPAIGENSFAVDITPSSVKLSAPFKNKSRAILLSIEGGAKPHKMGPRPFGSPFGWKQKSESLGGRVARRFLGRRVESFTGRLIDVFQVAKRSRREFVNAQTINHPGMKGFGMIASAAKHMERVIAQFGNNLNVDLTKTLIGNTAGPIGISTSVGPIQLS